MKKGRERIKQVLFLSSFIFCLTLMVNRIYPATRRERKAKVLRRIL